MIFDTGSIIGVKIQSKIILKTGFFPFLGGTKSVDIINVIIIPIQAIVKIHEYTIGKLYANTELLNPTLIRVGNQADVASTIEAVDHERWDSHKISAFAQRSNQGISRCLKVFSIT